MITASHNPPEFNGIKCVSSDGTELSRDDEEKIEDTFFSKTRYETSAKNGAIEKVIGAGESYIDAILSHIDVASIKAAGLKAVVDCANGAGCSTTTLLMKRLGVKATTLNADPQGEFPGHPSEPSEENLKDLMALMKANDADIGIAHDGDADRTVFVSDKGEYVSGDKGLALLSKFELKKHPGGIVVTPVSTSSLVEDVVKKAGGTILYTAVGSPVVARAMMSTGAVFGGEENGGLIFPELQFCRDGAMSAAKMLECVAKEGSISKQMKMLPVYHTFKFKVDCPDDKKEELTAFLASSKKGSSCDETDGLKIMYDDGWVLIRPSGTEPIYRIYSESKDGKIAKKRCEEFRRSASEFLSLS